MAKLDDLKTKATEMGIDFKSKATIADLELLIALKEDEETNPPIEETPEARLEVLKELAKELEIEFNDDVTVSELEALVQAVLDAVELPSEDKPEDETPKLNKDGFEAGKILTPAEVAEYLAKQRAKK